jgi:RNA polymerase primary sigma factor
MSMSDDKKPKATTKKKTSSRDEPSGAQYDIQAQYLSEIGKYNLLTAEEEQALAKRVSEGDEEAKRLLVLSNLRLVVTIAKRYTGHGQSLMDLVEEGNIGLIKAAGKFDYRKGFRFSTYASWWIKQSITRGIANQSRTIRIPVHIYQLINRYVKEEERRGLKAVDDEIMAEALDVPIKKIKLVKSLIHGIRSDEPLVSAEALQKLSSDAHHVKSQTPEEIVGLQFENEFVTELIDEHLSEREQEILKIRFGLDGEEPQTLAAAGKVMGVSRERIRQIEKRALKKLNIMLQRTSKREDFDG